MNTTPYKNYPYIVTRKEHFDGSVRWVVTGPDNHKQEYKKRKDAVEAADEMASWRERRREDDLGATA